jgi:hypothetical protein
MATAPYTVAGMCAIDLLIRPEDQAAHEFADVAVEAIRV